MSRQGEEPPSTSRPAPAEDGPQFTLDPAALDPGEEIIHPRTRSGPRLAAGRRTRGLTADGRLKTGKLAGLSMGAAVWTLSWPVLVESLLNSTVGLTDTVFAAEISEGATDAIGAAAYILWFMGLVIMAVSVGATALVSRATGAGRSALAHAATAQAVMLALVCGVGVGLLSLAGAAPLASLLELHGEAREAFLTYLRLYTLCVPAVAVISAGIACARGAGDSKRPLFAMVVVNVVNIVGSYILSGVQITALGDGGVTRVVLENPFGFDLGIAGIALGTVIGEYVGAAVVLIILVRGKSGVRLKRHRMRPHWHTMKRLVRVGLPSFFETFGMWLGNFAVILLVAAMPPGVMGCHILAIRLEAFSFLPGFALGTGAATLAGQYLGAGSPQRARRAVNICTACTALLMGVMGVLFCLFPLEIVALVSRQPTHLAVTPQLLFITGLVQIPFGLGIVWRSALRGVGDTRAVMVIMWVCTYLVRLPLAWAFSGVDIRLFGFTFEHPFLDEPSLAGLWIGLSAEVVIRGAIFGVRYFRGEWTKARV